MGIAFKSILITVLAAAALFATVYISTGAGTVQRMITLGGIYAVCKPNGYDVVCFVNKGSSDHPLSCLPLREATNDGECK